MIVRHKPHLILTKEGRQTKPLEERAVIGQDASTCGPVAVITGGRDKGQDANGLSPIVWQA